MSDSGEPGFDPVMAVLHIDRRNTTGIVVGVDGGPAAAAAMRWAARYSRDTGLNVQAVHAWQLKGPHIRRTPAIRQAASADARARATRWVVDALAAVDPELPWTLGIVEAAAGPALVDRSRTSPLLVVGTGGHNGLRGVVTGSVSRYVVGHAVPPVVVVRTPPAESDEEWSHRLAVQSTDRI